MSESSEFERKLESGLGDEPSRQRRQTALNFVIAKCEAYRDFAALVVPVLTRLSASDAATTKAMRGELLALISSREYLDLRARCERLQALTRQGTTVMSVRVRIIGSFPKALGDDLMGSLYSLERAVRELGADTGQEPPCVYQPESLDRYEPYAETARRLLAKERLKLDADLDAAARAAQREDLYALARRIQQSTQDVSALEAQARLEMGGVDQLLADKIIAREVLRSSPWYSGSFYLTAFVVIVTAISVAQNFVTAWAFPIVVVGGLIGTTVIGALQLRADNRLSERNFIELMRLAFGRLDGLLRLAGNAAKPTKTSTRRKKVPARRA